MVSLIVRLVTNLNNVLRFSYWYHNLIFTIFNFGDLHKAIHLILYAERCIEEKNRKYVAYCLYFDMRLFIELFIEFWKKMNLNKGLILVKDRFFEKDT